jgi:hypothetical protein
MQASRTMPNPIAESLAQQRYPTEMARKVAVVMSRSHLF